LFLPQILSKLSNPLWALHLYSIAKKFFHTKMFKSLLEITRNRKMKISVPIYEYRRIHPLEQLPEKMRIHGVDAVDYADLYNVYAEPFTLDEEMFEKTLKHERSILENGGITVDQIHGPWRYPPKDDTPYDRSCWLEAMKKGIRGAAYLGATRMVVHPLMPYGIDSTGHIDEVLRINTEHFTKLCEYAKDYPVTICLENMPYPLFAISTVKQVLSFVKKINKSNFKVCLDTGHANVLGTSPGEAVRILGTYLEARHVHDNNGKNDQHLHIGEGTIDWKDFSQALYEIGFNGVVSAEPNMRGDFTNEQLSERQAILAKNLKKIAENNWA
jgi:sugar phosphate isomerase/epimerase